MYKKGDFHSHTTASDGKYSPSALVNMAKEENIDIISITDHDTICGVKEGIAAGEKIGVKVIPGVELSTLHDNVNIHILGYFKDENKIGPVLRKHLKEMDDFRYNRGKAIVDKLYESFNIKLDYDKILKDANGIIARPHIAKAIIESGYDYSWEDIFHNFIGDGCAAYIPNKKLTTEEGIQLLRNEGALVVLAHPVLIKTISVDDLLKLPFHGIEAIYPINSTKNTAKFKKLARKHNKIITAGSDFHGITKDDSKHASKIGSVHLDESEIDVFLSLLNSI